MSTAKFKEGDIVNCRTNSGPLYNIGEVVRVFDGYVNVKLKSKETIVMVNSDLCDLLVSPRVPLFAVGDRVSYQHPGRMEGFFNTGKVVEVFEHSITIEHDECDRLLFGKHKTVSSDLCQLSISVV